MRDPCWFDLRRDVAQVFAELSNESLNAFEEELRETFPTRDLEAEKIRQDDKNFRCLSRFKGLTRHRKAIAMGAKERVDE